MNAQVQEVTNKRLKGKTRILNFNFIMVYPAVRNYWSEAQCAIVLS